MNLELMKTVEFLKTAQGTAEKYAPWYGAAAGGFGGAALGSALAPAKYKTIGGALGTLVGTGAGVHGGEAVGKKIDQRLAKTAAEEKKPTSPMMTLGKSVLGLGAGIGVGYAGLKGIDYLAARKGMTIPARGAMAAIPLVTGALGMAAPYLHQATLDKMRADHLKRQEVSHGAGTG